MSHKVKLMLKVGMVCVFLMSALLITMFSQPVEANREGIDLPPGFALLEIASGMTKPLDVEFIPSGEILIAEKGTGEGSAGQSAIRLIRHGILQEEPVLTLSTNVQYESGIGGLILDPEFYENHYFYLWYATGENTLNWDGSPKLRLSRFTLDLSAGTVDPESEQIILGDLDWRNIHNGGGMVFDAQGYLYLSIGDISLGPRAQDLGDLHGKVLRIQPQASGYTIPADNPFVGVPDADPEIYSLGLRNPYRMTRRLSDDQLFLGDVGWVSWEEVNRVAPAANFGWPIREGPCPQNEIEPCEPAPADYTEPELYYPHSLVGASITALAFYEGQAFPPEYQGQLFFADYNSQYIAFGDVEADDPAQIEPFAQQVGRIVDMEYHKDNLYLLDFNAGNLSMIYYQEAENQAPSATLALDTTVGASPLTVTLSAEDVTDPDDIIFSYEWDFGDQSEVEVTQTPLISHTYSADGSYVASLKVIDARGAESDVITKTITVYSESELPQIELLNLSHPTTSLYHGGDQIQYRVIRESGTAGLDPERPYTWHIERLIEQQIEPLVIDQAGTSGVLDIPRDNYGGTLNLFYRFYLTMHTADGLHITVPQALYPAIVNLSVQTYPPGRSVLLNQEEIETPYHVQAIVGVEHDLEVASQILYNKMSLDFISWQLYEGAATGPPNTSITDNPSTLIVPAVDATYQARYSYTELMLPMIMR